LHTQQRLVGVTGVGPGGVERRGGAGGGGFGKGLGGATHERVGFVGGGAGGGFFETFADGGELLERAELAVANRGGVFGERGDGRVLLAKFPDADGDLALDLDELFAGAAVGAAGLIATA